MNKFARFFLLLAGCFCVNVVSAKACSCSISHLIGKTERQRVGEARRSAKAVFSGKVIEIVEAKTPEGETAGHVRVKFEVRRGWKGIDSPEIVIHTTNICCICGYPFKVGESYLVYAHAAGQDKSQLWTTICTRTKNLGDAEGDVKVLSRPKYVGGSEKAL